MRFGICTSIKHSSIVKEAGWEFIEESVQGLFEGLLDDAEWKGLDRARSSAPSIPSANMLVPAKLKITGLDANLDALRTYMQRVLARAEQTKTRMLVFGSGGARQVPDGFDHGKARQQIIGFARMSAPIAAKHGITLVAEHLNRAECNIITSVSEAMEYVRAVNHPNFQCLVDTYHLWVENEPLSNIQEAIASIRHVHLADKDGRVAPGLSGTSDYRPIFGILKRANYGGLISAEATGFDIAKDGKRVLEFLNSQWAGA